MSAMLLAPHLLVACSVVSFVITLVGCRAWIPLAHKAQLVGKDMNKIGHPLVAEMGGVAVVGGFVGSLLLYIGVATFYLQTDRHVTVTLAVLATILLVTVLGILDDILGWKVGLRQWHKPLLALPCALPMMAVNAGHSLISLPVIGQVDLGLVYPLVVIPTAIVGAANGFNLLAGYNGLEAGLGIIILSALGIMTWQLDKGWVALFAFSMVAALAAFLWFNWCPARLFPGDTLTFAVGALIACVAILGNVEKMAVLLFLPFFADFFLLIFHKNFKVEAFAHVQPDGSLQLPYVKLYDVTHYAIAGLRRVKKRVLERDVVLSVWGLELVLVVLSFFIWG